MIVFRQTNVCFLSKNLVLSIFKGPLMRHAANVSATNFGRSICPRDIASVSVHATDVVLALELDLRRDSQPFPSYHESLDNRTASSP